MENSNGAKNRRKEIDIEKLIGGKIPPADKQLEADILGICMLAQEAYEIAADIITFESFYVPHHKMIFKAMGQIFQKRGVIDVGTVCEQVRINGELDSVGGVFFIMQLTNRITLTRGLEDYCQIVQEKYLTRQLINIAAEILNRGYVNEEDVFILIDECLDRVSKLNFHQMGNDFKDMTTSMYEFLNELDKRAMIKTEFTGIPSGFPTLDRITNGWQNTDLITIAARPGAGKSTIALNLAKQAAETGNPVALFLLEIPNKQAMERMVSAETGIPFENVRNKLTLDQRALITEKTSKIDRLPIYIDDTTDINHLQIRSKVKTLIRKRAKQRAIAGLKTEEQWLVIVDYVQRLKMPPGARKDQRDQQIGESTWGLKSLAKDLNIPVIECAQLTRETDTRKGQRPILKDLADSASLEKDSDIVIFLYQPDENHPNEVTLEIAKHRNGKKLRELKMNGDFSIQKFTEAGGFNPTPLPANLFIQKGSKFNSDEFDTGFNADAKPFE